MQTYGKSGHAVPHTAPVPVPTAGRRRPGDDIVSRLERTRSWTSPIIQRTGPDPDAVARLLRQGVLVEAPAAPSDESPTVLVKRRKPRRQRPRRTDGPGLPTPAWDVDSALREAKAGATASDLAQTYGVSSETIRHQLGRRGFSFGHTRNRLPADRVTAIRDLVASGVSRMDTAAQTGHSYMTVRKVCADLPILRPATRAVTAADQASWVAAYHAGSTIPEIADTAGRSPKTVRRVLKDTGVTLRDDRAGHSGGANAVIDDTLRRQVATLYLDAQQTMAEIAHQVGVSPSTVSRVVTEGGYARPSSLAQRGRPGANRAADLHELMRVNNVRTADVRAWAATTGRHCPPRGVPPRSLVEDYLHDTRHLASQERTSA